MPRSCSVKHFHDTPPQAAPPSSMATTQESPAFVTTRCLLGSPRRVQTSPVRCYERMVVVLVQLPQCHTARAHGESLLSRCHAGRCCPLEPVLHDSASCCSFETPHSDIFMVRGGSSRGDIKQEKLFLRGNNISSRKQMPKSKSSHLRLGSGAQILFSLILP